MTTSDEPELAQETAELVRPYVITNGRDLLDDSDFSLITLVTMHREPPRTKPLDPEKLRLLELCAGGFLSVAEIAGHMQLPVGVVKILVSDLTAEGHLSTRAPIPSAQLVDRQILEEVLNGLQARFG
ncbi:DUF742 domain-containing protein [Streptomyces celluloflavus]|uniref:DUF742 domain-containing protein n=2 Tax=Streptomyces TaxID=1883 RepID=A0A4Q9I3S7_STRKA|nr:MULTISPECIES: DUF742 domain-containing protein [Streptomyces]MYU55347.1 DUF742 domain-containing protein [Streptomyces sp. SID7805]TBO61420.1 DUF742 domain-containing protein [Streptomyces kasugaensis]WSK10770.1 DUF742 domain-containing protein [Streptomyces celluloflavus]